MGDEGADAALLRFFEFVYATSHEDPAREHGNIPLYRIPIGDFKGELWNMFDQFFHDTRKNFK